MRRARWVAEVVLLTLLWLALWGDVSVANVLSGVVVATFVLALTRWGRAVRSAGLVVRPLPALAFLGWFAIELVKANVAVVRIVLSPRLRVDPAVVLVPLRTASPGLATFVADAITLTPGTLTLDVDLERRVLAVHVLQTGDVERARAALDDLEWRALRAFAPRDELEAARAARAAEGRR